MVSSGVTLTLWGEDASLTLVSHPSRDGGTIKIPYQGRCFIIQNSLVPNLFPLGWLKQSESLDETLREDECWWSSILTFTLFGFLRPDCIMQPSTKFKKKGRGGAWQGVIILWKVAGKEGMTFLRRGVGVAIFT